MFDPRPGGDAPPRMRAGQRWLVYAIVALVTLTGCAWLIASRFADPAVNADSQAAVARWALVAHGVGAYALLVLLGTLWPLHLRIAWRLRRNRATGIVMATTWTWLALSGLWLYYGGISARDIMSDLHWISGLAAMVLLAAHIAWGRRR